MPDPIITGTNGADTLNGTAKDDRIYGGLGADLLHGGDGNDYLNGGYNTDQLYGDAGNDVLDSDRDAFPGREIFDGGDGTDTLLLTYINFGSDRTINLETGTFTDEHGKKLAQISSIENLQYRGFGVTLTGSAVDNQIHVLASQARIDALGGDDIISIGSSSAVIDGGDGNDWLLLVRAEYPQPTDYRGYSVSLARPGVAQAIGLTPNGQFTVSNIENLAGSEFDDKLTGDAGNNVIAGLEGNDTLIGGAGNDILIGETRSSVPAAPWTNMDVGYVFPPRPVAANDDLLEGGLGNDKLIGGAGYDTISYAHAHGSVAVDLAAGKATGADGTDQITDVEAIIGSAYSDSLMGNAGANLLDGGAGDDTMIGGGGDDTYAVDSAGDTITEQAGGGNDTVRSSISYILTDQLENITLTGKADIDATGTAAANILTGNAGHNRLVGGAGDDIYVIGSANSLAIEAAGGGHDTVRSAVSTILADNLEDLELTGLRAIDGTGNALDNTITGNRGTNRIDGGAGADTMAGGFGSDTYYVDNIGDVVIEVANAIGVPHRDLVIASVSTTLSENVENLTLTGTGALNGTGNAADNVITGNDAANVLHGGGSEGRGNTLIGNGGNDTLYADSVFDLLKGGTGNDSYILDHGAASNIIEKDGEGIDTMMSTSNFGISDNVEIGIYIGSGSGRIIGNALDNTLKTGSGSDSLNGKQGADTMIGGAGWDLYNVDNTGDRIIEAAIPGDIDTVFASADYTMPANVEILFSTATRATGNAGENEIHCDGRVNVIDGGRGADKMIGAEGNDTYYVDNVGDVVVEDLFRDPHDKVISSISYSIAGTGAEDLTLTGSALRAEGNAQTNILVGNARNNELVGNGGNDTMIGGAGNDHYFVSDHGNTIVENVGEGTDTVTSTISFTLGDNIENLVLDGPFASDGTGNALDNLITGSAGDNRIDGGAGADTMIGGGGFDTFVVDNTGDTVRGTGQIEASVSFVLGKDLTNLTLTGKLAIDATGNDAANALIGNDAGNRLTGLGGDDRLDGHGGADTLLGGSGNDQLDGGTGADTMDGGLGDDTYRVDTAADRVSEAGGGGLDRVITQTSIVLGAGIEGGVVAGGNGCTITGNAADNILGGGAGNDILDGSDGNDTLFAAGGADTLRGGAGNDTLIGTSTASTQTGGSGSDTFIGAFDAGTSADIAITDFVSGADRLVLVNPFLSGLLLAGGFVVGTSAKDDNDIAIYDKSSGSLYADLDANGAGSMFLVARFTPGTNLAASDIQLISSSDYQAQVSVAANWLYADIVM